MTTDTNLTIQKSTWHFLSGTFLSRCSGLLRDIALAFAFGTEPLIAIFLLAFRFSHLARRLLGESSLNGSFIPLYEEIKQESDIKAKELFKNLNSALALITSALILTSIAGIYAALYYIPLETTTTQLLQFTAWMLPSLLFIVLYALNSALLSCNKQFFLVGVAPVAFNLILAFAALTFSSLPLPQALLSLCLFVSVGCFFQWLFTMKSTHHLIGGFFFGVHPFSKNVKKLFIPIFLTNIGIAAAQINSAVDGLFALSASTEGPALLWYANRIQQLPLAFFGIALSNALLPPLARAIKGNLVSQFQGFFQEAHTKIQHITIPLTCAMIITAPSSINLLFGRGQFNLDSVTATAWCLCGYAFCLYPASFVLIAAPTLNTQGDYKTPMRMAWFSMSLNIFLNGLFIYVLEMGVFSVAIATSIATFFNAYYLKRHLQKSMNLAYPHFSKVFLTCLCSTVFVFMIDQLLFGYIPFWNLIQGIPLNLSQNLWDEIVHFGTEGIAFVSCWLVLANHWELEKPLP